LYLPTKNTYKRPLINNNFKNILSLQEKKVNEKGIILLRLLWQYLHKRQQNILILPKSKQVKENTTKPYQTTKRP
jgi:putative ribosome biogenesis GTPase RsgA